MGLDLATLFTVAACITGLLGILLLVLWMQERSVPALAWWAAAYLTGAVAVALWAAQSAVPAMASQLPQALLFVACGMIWNGARLFHGRNILPVPLVTGAIAWIAATQFSAFSNSDYARVVLASLIIAAYAFLAAYELRRERRRALAARWLSFSVPLLHGAVFLAPISLVVAMPTKGAFNALFAVFALEIVLYVVGTAFVVVVMAKERVALTHKTAAMTDALTGLFNRRAFLEAAERVMAEQGRNSLPVSVLVFDLDHFKSINDRFGHLAGDEALKAFARTVRTSMRTNDVIGRVGGEEFAAVLPTTAEEATAVAERVRAAFETAGAVIADREITATVSVGVTAATPPVEIETLLARADAALYRAKRNGRNRVEVATGAGAGPTFVPAPAASGPRIGNAAASALP
jgi:diguanylate cyclase (GGDEF)-like protein